MRITAVISTDLFAGSAARPLQIIQVNVGNDSSEPTGAVQVRVDGPGVTTPAPARLTGVPPGATATVEVPVEFAAPYQPGTPRAVTAVAETVAGAGSGAGAPQRAEFPPQGPAAEPAGTMWMVS